MHYALCVVPAYCSLLPPALPLLRWWIVRQTFSGVSGMSMCRMPSGASASTTALTTAGAAAIVPASPAPLTPSGLTVDDQGIDDVADVVDGDVALDVHLAGVGLDLDDADVGAEGEGAVGRIVV